MEMDKNNTFYMNQEKLKGLSDEKIKQLGFKAGQEFVKQNKENFEVEGSIYLKGFLEGMEYELGLQQEYEDESIKLK